MRCVPDCKSNYLTSIRKEGAISVYRFPQDDTEKERWIAAVSRADLRELLHKFVGNDGDDNNNKKPVVVVCRKHWPAKMSTYLHRGKPRPIDPPSIFHLHGGDNNIQSESTSKPRKTIRALTSARSVLPDQLEQFLAEDIMIFDKIEEQSLKNEQVIAFKINDNSVCVQSCPVN